MKKLSMLVASSLLLLTACSSGGTSTGDNNADSSDQTVTIGITQIVEHPSLDAARKGFIQALKDDGYEEGKNLKLDIQYAQGDMSNNMTIAQKLVNDGDDLILAISTPSAQAVAQQTKDIPVLFTAVTDPLGAKLVDSIEKPGANVTGTSDTHPDAIKNTIKSIKDFFPDAKNVGIIYNSGEQNSVVNVDKAKEELKANGLTAVEATITNSSEVKQAADSLVGRCDVIYIPKDNTVVSALESVISVANDKDIPLFVGESDSVKRGGFAGYGFEYFDLGYKTGQMAIDILKNGKNPSDIPVGFPDDLNLVLNETAAKEQGITLTDDMKKFARLVQTQN
ncbi:MAG TPA: ABC transporter substrate-binding protein [Bacilli bacterium]|nr:ABC transporter substrate-binding protein [Bacilli bacterium]